MVDKSPSDESTTTATATEAPAPGVPPRRPPGHRSTDVRDTVAEMAARAQEISQEAGSKVSQAMKDVIGAAAGLVGFTVESARDLVQYMVRRGQMTQEEADRLLREAEEAAAKKRPAVMPPTEASRVEAARQAKLAAVEKASAKSAKPAAPAAKKSAPAAKSAKSAPKAAAKKSSPARPKASAKPAKPSKGKAAQGKKR